jgi:AGZA family xanthine/uracil permease-like MFS transporter
MTEARTSSPAPETAGGRGALDRFFEITKRGSTYAREIRGGVLTFVTMAYIVVLNPLILGGFSADAATLDVEGPSPRAS